jgi:hypothetical protein
MRNVATTGEVCGGLIPEYRRNPSRKQHKQITITISWMAYSAEANQVLVDHYLGRRERCY